MPRTLPAALTTVMDAGVYEPYFRLVFNGGPDEAGQQEVQPISYVLEPLRLFITIPDSSEDLSYFRLRRGALINGSPVYISTIWFKKVFETHNGRVTTLIGEPLERTYLATAGTGYADVIGEATARATDEIIARYEGTNPAWRLYEFYKDSQPVKLSPRSKLFPLLAQKYFVYATEDGFDESASENYMWFFQATTARATDYTVNDPFLTVTDHTEARRLLATDEIGTLRSSGSVTDVIHNLGFLHSTADMPTNTANTNVGSVTSRVPVHLKYRTGDKVSLLGTNCSTTQRVVVTEVLNPAVNPAWYMVLNTLQYYGGSDGNIQPDLVTGSAQMSGPYLPELILGGGTVIIDDNGNIDLGTAPTPGGGINLGSAPIPAPSYSPLFTGSFNSALSEKDSNIQEAFETLDRHTHTGLVTNGNSHDHNGGDGGQISHINLTATGQFTHAQVDDMLTTGWIPRSESWSRTGNHTFTISGDYTAVFRKGTKIRYKDGGAYEYGVVASSSFSNPTTTVTLITNSDYAMAAVSITDRYISYIENPEGFPQWFNFTSPTVTCSGSMTWTTGTTVHAAWRPTGKDIEVSIFLIGTTGGTASNKIYAAPPVAVAAPFTAAKLGITQVRDGAAGSTVVGSGFIDNTNGITVYKPDDSNWTLGASRVIFWNGSYPY